MAKLKTGLKIGIIYSLGMSIIAFLLRNKFDNAKWYIVALSYTILFLMLGIFFD